jgi:hypothetical protein
MHIWTLCLCLSQWTVEMLKVTNSTFLSSWKIITEEIQYLVNRFANLHMLYEIRKNRHSNGSNVSLYPFIIRATKLVSNYGRISLWSTSHKNLFNYHLSRLIPHVEKLLSIIRADSDVTDKLLYSQILCTVRNWRKKREYNWTVHQLFIHFKKAYDRHRREVLYSNVTEFCRHVQLVSLLKICLN